MAPAFNHASCDESGTDAGREFKELSDVTFHVDRILIDAQEILDCTRRLDKPAGGFAQQAVSEFHASGDSKEEGKG